MTMDPLASVRENTIWIIVACAAILVIGLGAILGVWLSWRRWVKGNEESGGDGSIWSLDDLRQMRDRGDLTEAEYQAMRGSVIDAFRGQESATSGRASSSDFGLTDDNATDFDLKK